jgi:hypothetical protein
MPAADSEPTCAMLMAAIWLAPNLATSDDSMLPICVTVMPLICVAVSEP